ncbi:hypothetical protein BH11PSE2_BH11PSE2_15790 [soil metagenome]
MARTETRRAVLGASAAVAGFSLAPAAFAAPERGPGKGPWKHDKPQAHGLNSAALDKAADQLAAAGERQGLVVIRHGVLVYERYWANAWAKATPEWRNVSFSSAKSWHSTMTGLAITQGNLKVDNLIAKWHPETESGFRPGVTLRHLLTMSTGGTLEQKPPSLVPKKLADMTPPGPGFEYTHRAAPPAGAPAGYAVTLEPGKLFYYDGAAVDHLSDVVAGAVGQGTHKYIMDGIVAPLGCEAFNYQPEGIDHKGNIRIGGSIQLSCRDMARLGQLYLNGGRWAGKQLIAPSYIRQAISPSQLAHHYGFLWWLNGTGRTPSAPKSMYMANGARGQFCFVLPEHDMVIATMGFGEQQLATEDAWKTLAPILPKVAA